ncbi:MAG: hypothetical protein ACYCSO_06120 [Cuniculiplasma sp.]
MELDNRVEKGRSRGKSVSKMGSLVIRGDNEEINEDFKKTIFALSMTATFLGSIFLGAGFVIHSTQAKVSGNGSRKINDINYVTTQDNYSHTDIKVPQINGGGWEYFKASVHYSYTFTENLKYGSSAIIKTYNFLNFPPPTVCSASQYVSAHVSNFNGYTGLKTTVGYIQSNIRKTDIVMTQEIGLRGTISMSGWFITSLNANLKVVTAADPYYSYVTGNYTYSKTYPISSPSFPVTFPITIPAD